MNTLYSLLIIKKGYYVMCYTMWLNEYGVYPALWREE